MGTKDEARAAASHGENVRDRVRDLTARALKGRGPGRRGISGLVTEVLEGAAAGIDESVPSSPRSVLRQVYEGLNDAVHAAATAGAGAARAAGRRGAKLVTRDVPAAGRQLKSANEEFLGAVSRFAGRVSGEAREELDELVRRARRVGPAVAGSARDVAHAADGRLLELTGEAARAGVSVVRRAAGGLAMAAGGLLEGLGKAVAPTPARKAGLKKRKTAPRKAVKIGKRRSASRRK